LHFGLFHQRAYHPDPLLQVCWQLDLHPDEQQAIRLQRSEHRAVPDNSATESIHHRDFSDGGPALSALPAAA